MISLKCQIRAIAATGLLLSLLTCFHVAVTCFQLLLHIKAGLKSNLAVLE